MQFVAVDLYVSAQKMLQGCHQGVRSRRLSCTQSLWIPELCSPVSGWGPIDKNVRVSIRVY